MSRNVRSSPLTAIKRVFTDKHRGADHNTELPPRMKAGVPQACGEYYFTSNVASKPGTAGRGWPEKPAVPQSIL